MSLYRLRTMWADAVRYGQWEEADRLWKLLMKEWLTPKPIDWNDMLERVIAARERRDASNKLNDVEWDNRHGDFNQ